MFALFGACIAGLLLGMCLFGNDGQTVSKVLFGLASTLLIGMLGASLIAFHSHHVSNYIKN